MPTISSIVYAGETFDEVQNHGMNMQAHVTGLFSLLAFSATEHSHTATCRVYASPQGGSRSSLVAVYHYLRSCGSFDLSHLPSLCPGSTLHNSMRFQRDPGRISASEMRDTHNGVQMAA